MEIGAWYTKTVEAGYEEVFHEALRLLDREKWIVESYHNQSEILAESGRIFPQGINLNTNAEIIITYPNERKGPDTPDVDSVVPVVITEADAMSIISTVGDETFDSIFSGYRGRNNKLLWEELTAIIDDAAAEASS